MSKTPNPGWPRSSREVTPRRRELAERLTKHIASKGVSLHGADPVDWVLHTETVGAWMFEFLAEQLEAAQDQSVRPAPRGVQADLFS